MTAKCFAPISQQVGMLFQYQTNLFHSILVVEDNELIRRVNAEVLIRSGYEVNVAEDGAAAWEAIQFRHYDLLVTDNEMPELSGIELLYKLQAVRRAMPVVLASGTMPEEKLKLHPGLQIDATLLKPYTPDEFLATVKKVIRATDGLAAQTTPPPGWQDQSPATGMKISLQNCRTGQFMRCDSVWTADINEALNFRSFQRAFCFGMNELQDPFQVLQIEESEGSAYNRIRGASERLNSHKSQMGKTPHSA
jgi:CheY-like chemotaxis protein